MVATGFYTAEHIGVGYFIRRNRDRSKISCSLMRRFVIILPVASLCHGKHGGGGNRGGFFATSHHSVAAATVHGGLR